MSKKPYIIALEGLDNTGKTTFAHALHQALVKLKIRKQIDTNKLMYVCPSFGVGSKDMVLRDCLSAETTDYCRESQALIALAALRNAYHYYRDADVLIFDRYYYSTSAYQNISINKIKHLANAIGLPEPDKIIMFTHNYNTSVLDRLDVEFASHNTDINRRLHDAVYTSKVKSVDSIENIWGEKPHIFHQLSKILELDKIVERFNSRND